MRPSRVLRILRREFQGATEGLHTPVMLWGAPGVGKSEIVAQVAAGEAVALIDLRLSQLEPSDLRGIPFREGDHVEWSVPSMMPDTGRHGPAGILFLDEINAAVPSVAAAAYQLILDRRLGDYRVPDGWAIFAAGNRLGDRGITYAMPAPLANRFTHLEVEPDPEDWQAWARGQGVDPRLRAFLDTRRDLLLDFRPDAEAHAFPTPRSWAFADRALKKFADAPDLLAPALAGCVGESAAAALLRFLDTGLPTVDALLAGETSAIPDDPDGQLTLVEAVLDRLRGLPPGEARLRAAEGALTAARGFPAPEIGLKLVIGLRELLDREVYRLPAFGEWADAVADAIADVEPAEADE